MCLLLSSFGILSIRECIWLNDYYMCVGRTLILYGFCCFFLAFAPFQVHVIAFIAIFFNSHSFIRSHKTIAFHAQINIFSSASIQNDILLWSTSQAVRLPLLCVSLPRSISCAEWQRELNDDGQRFLCGCTLNTVWCQCTLRMENRTNEFCAQEIDNFQMLFSS